MSMGKAGSDASEHNSAKPDHGAKLSRRAEELLADRIGQMPTWVRLPSRGVQIHTGLGRSKIYELIKAGAIRSVSVCEPGKVRGTRLVNLQSLFDYISKCEAEGGKR